MLLRYERRRGFTLIELLITIGIISVIAASVFVSLNPAQRFAQARNSRRIQDVSSILTAIHQYIVDNDGDYPTGLTTTLKQLGTCTTGGATACAGADAACLNIATALAPYLRSMPIDPDGDSSTTHYSALLDANGIVTISACSAELSEAVTVSR